MPSLKQICLATVALVLALTVGVWQSYMTHHLEFTPVSLEGKTVVITGATDGIGKENAFVFAEWNVSTLILPVRNEKKGLDVKEEILKSLSPATRAKVSIEVVPGVDLKNFESVRQFALKMKNRRVDILINNAGMSQPPVEKTVDGNEAVFQVNHLSPFLLTHLLTPSLHLSPSPRVVFVGSGMHYLGSVGKTKYSKENRGLHVSFDIGRYSDTKLMNTMTALTFAEKDKKVVFSSLNPGLVMSNLDGNLPPVIRNILQTVRRFIARSPRQGTMTQVTLATHPKLGKEVSGRYFSDHCMDTLCNRTCLYCDREKSPGVVPLAEASDKAARDWLWQESCEITGAEC